MNPDDTFELVVACKKEASSAIDLYKIAIKQATIAINRGGGDLAIIGAGMRAAERILAYGYGQPSQKMELSGKDGRPIEIATFDPAQMSLGALQELAAARSKR